ncbi:hypothetical protein FRC00_000637 [Tulasnella sp. 408]|nr:hypothetical protein FRC00_000637 [Tulasnella sp. 408]
MSRRHCSPSHLGPLRDPRPLERDLTHASFETVLAETASEAEATTDGSQVFQPFIATRSIEFDSETDRTAQTRRTRSRARPQTQTVAQAAATETNDENTPAANTRPATAQHTPNQSQQHETADQATPRPDNTAQPTHRETNVNTPQPRPVHRLPLKLRPPHPEEPPRVVRPPMTTAGRRTSELLWEERSAHWPSLRSSASSLTSTSKRTAKAAATEEREVEKKRRPLRKA